MRTTPPIYNYTGLISGLGLASLLIGLVILVVLPNISLAAWMIMALGAALLIGALIIDFSKVRGAITGKRGKFSAGTTVMISVFIGITLLVNAISIKYHKSFDITELSQFTLTSQTKDVLSNIEMPVDVICFFIPTDPSGLGLDTYATNLLEEYQNYTDQLTVKVIDPDEQPDEAKKYNIDQYMSIVFESSVGRRTVTPDLIYQQAEHSFTSAILEVTGITQKTIYFLTGHGEAIPTQEYAYANQGLLDNLYKTEILDLMVYQAIPEDCSGLVIAGPQRAFTALEYRIIKEYLENDGRVLILVNPDPPDDIKALLDNWYLEIEDGTIIDSYTYYTNVNTPLVPRTNNEFGLTEVYFPGAASILPKEEYPEDLMIYPLFYTSVYTWAETEFTPDEEPIFSEGIDKIGSRAIGVFVAYIPPEEDEEETVPEEEQNDVRLIVVGDSDFASNQHFYNADNGYLFLSLIELMTMGEQLISIERKVLPYRSLVVEPAEQTFIRVSSIGLLPVLVLIAGAVIWWRRR
jgi:ABC-type uncharacterized transport system involved in gliding motility auxiliary subunit